MRPCVCHTVEALAVRDQPGFIHSLDLDGSFVCLVHHLARLVGWQEVVTREREPRAVGDEPSQLLEGRDAARRDLDMELARDPLYRARTSYCVPRSLDKVAHRGWHTGRDQMPTRGRRPARDVHGVVEREHAARVHLEQMSMIANSGPVLCRHIARCKVEPERCGRTDDYVAVESAHEPMGSQPAARSQLPTTYAFMLFVRRRRCVAGRPSRSELRPPLEA